MSVYPNNIDTDVELPRIDDGITEITGDTINSIRDAVIAIEQTVGINPQGNKNDLASRVAVSIDADGNIKATALAFRGLVTLPITDAQIASNAGIQESKLNLNFPTQILKNSINTITTNFNALNAAFNNLSVSFSLHTVGATLKHDGYSILINAATSPFQGGIGGLTATTIGDAVNQLAEILITGSPPRPPHIDFSLPYTVKHKASEISVDTANFNVISKSATDIQLALNNLDSTQGVFGELHVKGFHDNGIFKTITSGDGYNPSVVKLNFITQVSYSALGNVLTFESNIDGYDIVIGDILVISSPPADAGNYQVVNVGPYTNALGNLPNLNSNQVQVYHLFSQTTSSAIVSIYGPSTISSQLAPLATAVRNNETIVDSITIMNPNAARVVSIGFNPSIFSVDGYEIGVVVGIGNNQTRQLTIPNLNKYRLTIGQANPVSSESVAERINAYVSDPTLGFHFPISAFPIGDEIAIAHNLVGDGYTLEILDGYNANFAMGLDSFGANITNKIIHGNLNDNYVVNGVTLNSIKTIFDGYVSISSSTYTFTLYNFSGQPINPLLYDFGPGDILNILNHPTINVNGSYTLLAANSTTVSVFASEQIPAPTNPTIFGVILTNSNIALDNELDTGNVQDSSGIVQLFVDSSGSIQQYQRLIYTNIVGFGPAVSIVNVSDAFPPGSSTVNVTTSGNTISFVLVTNSIPGKTITIANTFSGSFNLYHYNNTEYLTINIGAGSIVGVTLPIFINQLPNVDELFKINTIHFNGGLEIDNLIDNRLFGNLAEEHIRDDFINLFSQVPTAELRGDGVVSGFDVLPIPNFDTQTNMLALPVQGGVAYVNGIRTAVSTQKVIVPAYDSSGNPLTGDRVIAINQFGTVKSYTDSLNSILVDGYNVNSVYGKLLPLYRLTLSSSGTNVSFTNIIDVRSFINRLDNKLDIIVEQNGNNVGNFKDFSGALLYIAAYPNSEKLVVRIVNELVIGSNIVVPSGVSIIGNSLFGGAGRNLLLNNSSASTGPMLLLQGNNILRNLQITAPLGGFNNPLVQVDGYNILIENCYLNYGSSVTNNINDIGIKINHPVQNVVIKNNQIDNVFTGILVNNNCNQVFIENNSITNISGTGGSISSGIDFISNDTGSIFSSFMTEVVISGNLINISSNPINDIRGININIVKDINSLIIKENTILCNSLDSATYGIQINNLGSTGSVIENLFILDNMIRGINNADPRVWGIYVDSINIAKIERNIIKNIGQQSQVGISLQGCIFAGPLVLNADIKNNVLSSSFVDSGIECQAIQASIIENTITSVGTTANYINGSTTFSLVSNNSLIGPGSIGINWSGDNSIISNNNLSAGIGSYAFSGFGIQTLSKNTDIMSNTISGMTFANGSVGISNGTTQAFNTKIVNNTIYGSLMSYGIHLFSSGQIVTDNKITNTINFSTQFINMNDVADSLIANNIFQGSVDIGFYSSSAGSLDRVSIIGNIFTASIATRTFDFIAAASCFISGNRLPESSPSSSDNIGPVPTSSTANTNSFGQNRNLIDSRGISLASGISATTSGGSPTAYWSLSTTNQYWQQQSNASGSKTLYFPLDGLTNGARLTSLQVSGVNASGGGNLTAQVIKKAMDGSFSTVTLGTVALNGTFIQTILSLSEIINYSESNYYIAISTNTTTTGDRIDGLTIFFKY